MLKFEFNLEELERLKDFANGRGSYYDEFDRILLMKLFNYISQLEAHIQEDRAWKSIQESFRSSLGSAKNEK